MDTITSIALNVSRARLTVIGFMLTIDIFALGIFLSNVDQHVSLQILTELSVFYALVASLCVGTLAATLMLISERFDPLGNSDVVLFAFAEMTMFVAIVQTISGISRGFIVLFHANLAEPAVNALGALSASADLLTAGEAFRNLIFWLIALTWIFLAYVAPLWSLSRLPVTRHQKYLFAGYYLLLSCAVFALAAHALHIELLARGESTGVMQLFLQNFWAPSLWGDLPEAV